MDPPESVRIEHTPAILQKAHAFADLYAREKPGYVASYGGYDGLIRQWLDSYDNAYSIGAAECGNGYMPAITA
jgi:hypothetical protein